ncbi:hypothetical protein N657DRAFT_424331 [Parathielavia appendiculata]|uniref:Uncharacterized protein n=1 Tax=Parathielavia appendiculata TaxID=2587402 RepID=A0AAN6TZR1_9PEZI|nr:hypothetical protein N657DRAFT_424331 [Parathielavia appendiculata]
MDYSGIAHQYAKPAGLPATRAPERASGSRNLLTRPSLVTRYEVKDQRLSQEKLQLIKSSPFSLRSQKANPFWTLAVPMPTLKPAAVASTRANPSRRHTASLSISKAIKIALADKPPAVASWYRSANDVVPARTSGRRNAAVRSGEYSSLEKATSRSTSPASASWDS